MTHLLEHGYRDIVVLTGPWDNFDSEARLAGCRAAMNQLATRKVQDSRVMPTALVIRETCGCSRKS